MRSDLLLIPGGPNVLLPQLEFYKLQRANPRTLSCMVMQRKGFTVGRPEC